MSTALARLGAVTPATYARAQELTATDVGRRLTDIHGYSPSTAPRDWEHHSGNALDLMLYIGPGGSIDTTAGDHLADYLWTHRARLGVRWIIWRQRIRTAPDGDWQWMGDRRGPADPTGQTVNHYDHIHVLFGGNYTPPTDTPTPIDQETEMRVITDGVRYALVGPGYICNLADNEFRDEVVKFAPLLIGGPRQYDVWAAACTQGVGSAVPSPVDAAALAGAVAALVSGPAPLEITALADALRDQLAPSIVTELGKRLAAS